MRIHLIEDFSRPETPGISLLSKEAKFLREILDSPTHFNIHCTFCTQVRSDLSIDQRRPLQLKRVRVASCVHAAAQGVQDQMSSQLMDLQFVSCISLKRAPAPYHPPRCVRYGMFRRYGPAILCPSSVRAGVGRVRTCFVKTGAWSEEDGAFL